MEPRTITVEGLRTRVLVEDGGTDREPIVLVHGVGGWAENWRPVMPGLASTGRQVIALDLPGFGQSEAPRRVRYFGPEEAFYPRFVIAAMDVLGIERAHIAGNSMGGAIAYMTAVTAPMRTRSIVLVARKGTRLNSSHLPSSYAVFCFKKKTRTTPGTRHTPPHRLRELTTPAGEYTNLL